MKKIKLLQKLASGKGFYLTVILSFCVIAFAASLIYRSSTDMLREVLTTPTEASEQARNNETDEADPRFEISTTAPTTQYETSLRFNDTDAQEQVAAEVTEADTEPSIINDSYILPASFDILRDYSPDIPIFDETMGDWRTHKGIDFAVKEGAAIKAVGNGKVTKVISDRSYGYIIEIDHGDFTARYCGLEQEDALKLDDRVYKGDTVGFLGDIPCEEAEESHLHFEIIKGGAYAEPLETMGITQ